MRKGNLLSDLQWQERPGHPYFTGKNSLRKPNTRLQKAIFLYKAFPFINLYKML